MVSKTSLLFFGGIAILLVAAAGYYFIYPFFRVERVDEALETSARAMGTSVPITDTKLHPAEGTARVYEHSDGTRHVRLENFKTIDGPNLHVYLMKDLDATEFIDLGHRKGTEGSINYAIPDGVDLSEYRYLAHWCVPFSVLFNYADIGATAQ